MIEQLRAEQERLHRQGEKMMAETGIIEVLARHGEFLGPAGSYESGLMVHPDLDVNVIAPVVDRAKASQVLADVYANAAVQFAGITDLVNFRAQSKHPEARPTGYYLGIKIPFEGDMWNIDCWLQQSEWRTAQELEDPYAKKLATLDQAGRDAVLLLKHQLIERGEYGSTYLSSHVYDAVLAGDRTLEDFYARNPVRS